MDLFEWIEGLGRILTVQVQSASEKIYNLGGMQKNIRYVVKFGAQKFAISCFMINCFSTWSRTYSNEMKV